jgi:hypothetical protein
MPEIGTSGSMNYKNLLLTNLIQIKVFFLIVNQRQFDRLLHGKVGSVTCPRDFGPRIT